WRLHRHLAAHLRTWARNRCLRAIRLLLVQHSARGHRASICPEVCPSRPDGGPVVLGSDCQGSGFPVIPGRTYTPDVILAVAWRRKWTIVLPAIVVTCAVAVWAHRLPDEYEA